MSRSVSFLTWNLALLARSSQAPPWWGQDRTEQEVRARVLDLEPDIVAFQELPGLVPFVETHDMVRANPRSHSGNLATLVSNDLLARIGDPEITVVAGCALLITIAGPDGTDPLTIANVHLAPGSGGRAERLDQLADIVAASPTPELAVIGDSNTRIDELDALAEAGLSSPRPPRSTWNSRRNRFNRSGPEFTASFTRAFVSPGLGIEGQAVLDTPIEADGHRFHLSDHFALTGHIRF